ncbi:hypothetical protein HPB49_005533 [Dermacentor silvarum]|uniref:Uncharacterized protein n=1 Tax=Dermacentor silvarum TaxID=543639 RepID=A0ACB8DW02_DERSI|nr:hypothetical protein HPB49_005533 [Dermacentor silvarum]
MAPAVTKRTNSSTTKESTVVPANLRRRSKETAQSSAPKRRRPNKDPLSPGVRLTMAVRVRLLSDRDSETTSVVVAVIMPAPVVWPTTAASRNPTTEESTVVPTFAMLGSEECPGVVSLMPSKIVPARGQAAVIAILYLTIHKVKEAGILLEPLLKGNKNRTHHASWSHAIFQRYATVTENATSTSKETRVSMCSVNLAGSERAAAASRDTEDQMRECTKLNLSLLALGNCIDARSKNGTQQVPYQDSKLTQILKDSLGGSGSAFMIGTATAVKLSYVETYTTLEYAPSGR